MPFSFSHPAAILPIHSRFKKWISLPSLVIGSIVPDAGYYLLLPDHYKENAHTWLGAVTFALPVGLIILLIFYWIAPEVALLLQSRHRERVPSKKTRGFLREALMAACGIVLGAETHILWDSFTHETGWLVMHIPVLREPLWRNRFPVYNVLQLLSSVVGLCILLYVYDRWTMTEEGGRRIWQRRSWRLNFWIAIISGCFVGAMFESHVLYGSAHFHFAYSSQFSLMFVTNFVRNLLVAITAVSLTVKFLRLRSTRYVPVDRGGLL
jgi:hypothetical protein